MKKLLLYAFAAVVALASCSKDPVPGKGSTNEGDEEVNYAWGVGIPENRYDMSGGGLANVNPEEMFLRYILEIYSTDGDEFVGRYERIVDFTTNSGTTFNLRIVPKEYSFLVWADFVQREDGLEVSEIPADPYNEFDFAVDAADAQDNYYNTADGLRSVGIIEAEFNAKPDNYYSAGARMTRDAYMGSRVVDIRSTTPASPMQLKRPFGRIAVYSKEMDPDRLTAAGYEVPDSVVVTYAAGKLYSKFDIFEGDVIENDFIASDMTFTNRISTEDHPIADLTLNSKTYPDAQLLMFDYVFAPLNNEPGEELPNELDLTLKLFSEEDELEDQELVLYDLAVSPNKESQVVGSIFGAEHHFDVVIDDSFGGSDLGYFGDEAFEKALTNVVDGGNIKLFAGKYKSEGLVVNKSVTISGVGADDTELFAEVPPEQAGLPNGKNPILFIDGTGVVGDPMEVEIKDLTLTIKKIAGDFGVDGITVSGNVILTLKNVVFDGIMNTEAIVPSPYEQHGRCVTVLNGAKVYLENCTFKKYNKNAVDVYDGGYAEIEGCTVIGNNYNAQAILDDGGNPYLKALQNGVVFRDGATGKVTDCTFKDITYNLVPGDRQAPSDASRAIYLYDFTRAEAEANTLVEVSGNTFTNCELHWSFWDTITEEVDAELDVTIP